MSLEIRLVPESIRIYWHKARINALEWQRAKYLNEESQLRPYYEKYEREKLDKVRQNISKLADKIKGHKNKLPDAQRPIF